MNNETDEQEIKNEMDAVRVIKYAYTLARGLGYSDDEAFHQAYHCAVEIADKGGLDKDAINRVYQRIIGKRMASEMSSANPFAQPGQSKGLMN